MLYVAFVFFQMLTLAEMIYPNLKSFVGDTMLDRHQHSGQKLTETPVAKFSYESMNSSLKALINIKAILFLIQWPFWWQNHPK